MAQTKKTITLDQLKKLANRTGQEIATLAGLVVDAVEAEFSAITIPVTAWKANTDTEKKTVGLEYMADVPVEGVDAKDAPDVVLKVGSMATASACGMATVATAITGAIRFFSVAIPQAPIQAQVRIIQGK